MADLLSPAETAVPVCEQAEVACPACLAGNLRAFFDLGQVPTRIGIQYGSRDEAINCRMGPIRLAYCDRCSFISNVAFSAKLMDYENPYDNDLGFSAVYQEYEQDLIARLNRHYDLRGKRVVEIGCGKGGFLKRLCTATGSRGQGFDPSLSDSEALSGDNVELIPGYYPGNSEQPADLIVCRQVFEHLPDPLSFLTQLRSSIGETDRTAVYFEVPNFEFVLTDLALWTVIYEHCSYFTRESLAGVFETAGFEVRRVYDSFQGQFIGIESVSANRARTTASGANSDGQIAGRIAAFIEQLDQKISNWKTQLDALKERDQRAVIWGAGARAVSFCNLLKIADDLPYAVDVNPNKSGKYLPGTGQRIVPPAFLREYRPGVIIVMNAIYRDEIRRCVDALGLAPQYLFA